MLNLVSENYDLDGWYPARSIFFVSNQIFHKLKQIQKLGNENNNLLKTTCFCEVCTLMRLLF